VPGDQEDKRGHPFVGPAGRMLATVHPSFIQRIEDEADKRAQYRQLAADLNTCTRVLAKAA
jgi:uracil-DNA glycosylase